MSYRPGWKDSGNRHAYIAAPRMYRTPCNTSQNNPICSCICCRPYIFRPWMTGKTALSPIATNRAARYGRTAEVRNAGCIVTTMQPSPKVVICGRLDRARSEVVTCIPLTSKSSLGQHRTRNHRRRLARMSPISSN